ncbi:biotin carboxylase N-terminal domain-containing protein [Bradyrhizobium sp. RDT10]
MKARGQLRQHQPLATDGTPGIGHLLGRIGEMRELPFHTILIANRGEIAVRIIKTLRRLGLRSAIVYHDADAGTPAVSMADTAIAISGRTPIAAYLDIAQIIAAAHKASADALHPGYGFLSENAEFARAVIKAGIAFIGPAPKA